jgi:hypothetical protein
LLTDTATQQQLQPSQTVEQKTAPVSELAEEGLQPAQQESAQSFDITLNIEESTTTLLETRTTEVSVNIAAEEAKLELEKPKHEEVEAVVAPETALTQHEGVSKPETRVGVLEEAVPHEDIQPGLQPASGEVVASEEVTLVTELAKSQDLLPSQTAEQKTAPLCRTH